MRIVNAIISDRGEKYLPDAIANLCQWLPAPMIADFTVIDDREHRLGMAGAAKAAWEWALEADADYLFHFEEDFRFNSRVPLHSMVRILERNPHLAQVVLKRQPWSSEEKAAGGQIETDPSAYEDRFFPTGEHWLEHRKLFSVNPCLIPRKVLEQVDPTGGDSGLERKITDECLKRGWSFAMFGARHDPPLCTHVGVDRGGDGWHW